MKLCSWLLCLSMASSLQASLRNPFMMPAPYCEETLKQLDSWRLKGIIGSYSRYIALMAHPQQPALRVRVDTDLMVEVKVVAVSLDTVSVSLAGICDGAYYHWHLSGGQNDKKNSHRVIATTTVRDQSE